MKDDWKRILSYTIGILTIIMLFMLLQQMKAAKAAEQNLPERQIAELKMRYPPGKHLDSDFAMILGCEVFGNGPKRHWKKLYTLDKVQAGDIIRYENNSHSIFVTDVSGDWITFADGNPDGNSVVRWDMVVNKKDIAGFNWIWRAQ